MKDFSPFCNCIHEEIVKAKKCDEKCEFGRYFAIIQEFFDRSDKSELQKLEYFRRHCRLYVNVFFNL